MKKSVRQAIGSLVCDAHVHSWRFREANHLWLEDCPELQQDYSLGELEGRLEDSGVSSIYLVQSGSGEQENERLIAISEQSSLVAGVIGSANSLSSRLSDVLKRQLEHPCMRGVRLDLREMATHTAGLANNLKALAEQLTAEDKVLEFLASENEITVVEDIAAHYPQLKIVVDHAWSLLPASEGHEALLGRLASHSNVSAKLSGFHHRAAGEQVVAALIGHFGAGRVLWGSDWPLIERHVPYRQALAESIETVGRTASPDEVKRIMSLTAQTVYSSRAK